MQPNIPAVFNFTSESSVRVVQVDGNPWFVATDVCSAIAVQNAAQAVARLDEDERSMFNIGRQGSACIVNESGLYSLILGSRKPEAKKFKKWVTSEVLPSIRKTGSYAVQTAQRKRIAKPDTLRAYFAALLALAGQDGPLWIGLTELVFSRLCIKSLDEITPENLDQAVAIVRDDMAGARVGAVAAMRYRPGVGVWIE